MKFQVEKKYDVKRERNVEEVGFVWSWKDVVFEAGVEVCSCKA